MVTGELEMRHQSLKSHHFPVIKIGSREEEKFTSLIFLCSVSFLYISLLDYLCCYDMLQPQPVSSRRPLPTPPKVSESAGIPVRRPSYEDKLVENSKSSSTSSSKDESCDLETPRVRVRHMTL